MVSMPNIKIAKPTKIAPVFLMRSRRLNRYITTPTAASTGVNEDGLSSWTARLSPSMPDRLRIHDVAVVPTLAPMITPHA